MYDLRDKKTEEILSYLKDKTDCVLSNYELRDLLIVAFEKIHELEEKINELTKS